MARKPSITDEKLKALKKKYDPRLIEAVLTHIDDYDLNAAYDAAISTLAERAGDRGDYDTLALQRRALENTMIEHETRMFDEIANLLTQVNDRYADLTGVKRASSQERSKNG